VHVNLGTAEPELGGTATRNLFSFFSFFSDVFHESTRVNPLRSYGSMENVSIVHIYNSLELMITASAAGPGKTVRVMWYENPFTVIIRVHELMLLARSAGVEVIAESGLATLACLYRGTAEKGSASLSSLLVLLGDQSRSPSGHCP
jgi:hypothetical protein